MARRYTGGFLSAKEQATDANTANGIFTLAEAQEKTALGNFPTGRWTPQYSLRFKNSSSTYLTRTPTVNGNRQIMTFSFWMKRGLLNYSSNYLELFTAYPNASNIDQIAFSPSSDSLRVWFNGSSSADLVTTQVFRDPSAWYHVVVSIDTTQSLASNRIKVYVNGSLVTSFSTATYPSQNYNTFWNSTSYAAAIGANLNSLQGFFDGYLAEIIFIDGQQLDPTYFGFTDAETSTWVPKRYTGTYGTNGYYLPFNPNVDVSSTVLSTPDFYADYVVVAGGGGGGNGYGAPSPGGGAGGYRTSAGTSGGNQSAESSLPIKLNTAYSIIVGAGGTGGSGASGYASKGFDSILSNIFSVGGGFGFSSGIVDGYTGAGGSGAGGSTTRVGYATIGQGSNGGLSIDGSGGLSSGVGYNMGGGGGAGATGGNATTSVAGAGGNGLATTISGSSVTYAGGGAGGNDSARVNGPASGGTGGGGSSVYGGAGNNGTSNTGGGGAGGSNRAGAGGSGYSGGNGGSGIIIIKIPNTRTATFSAGVTSSMSTAVSGYKVYTVTATSTTSETVTFS